MRAASIRCDTNRHVKCGDVLLYLKMSEEFKFKLYSMNYLCFKNTFSWFHVFQMSQNDQFKNVV